MKETAIGDAMKIRKLRLSDWQFVKNCDKTLNWGFSCDGPDFLLSACHSAFIAENRKNPVGMIFGFKWGFEVGWIGLLVVEQGFRQQGIGRALLKREIEELCSAGCLTIGLDSVPEMAHFYASEGFGPHQKSLRFNCPWIAGRPQNSIKLATEDDLANLLRFDRDQTGLDRSKLLKSTLKYFPGSIIVYISNDVIKGYLAFRHRPDLWQVGPWIAQSRETADTMFQHLLHSLRSDKKMIRVGALEGGVAARALKSLGFEEVFFSRRMYRGSPLQQPDKSFICIGDPACG